MKNKLANRKTIEDINLDFIENGFANLNLGEYLSRVKGIKAKVKVVRTWLEFKKQEKDGKKKLLDQQIERQKKTMAVKKVARKLRFLVSSLKRESDTLKDMTKNVLINDPNPQTREQSDRIDSDMESKHTELNRNLNHLKTTK